MGCENKAREGGASIGGRSEYGGGSLLLFFFGIFLGMVKPPPSEFSWPEDMMATKSKQVSLRSMNR